MTDVFIFDIDGTLTKPRQPMSSAFAKTFIGLCLRSPVYLASGSDYAKIVEQVPPEVIDCVNGIFPCAGAEFWRGSYCVYADDQPFPPGLISLFQSLMAASPYPHRFGPHVEKRTGMLNVSVVGRSANRQQREDYRLWDDRHRERAAIAKALSREYPAYEYAIGGDISIDIFPKGANKSRILQTLDRLHPKAAYRFFGDRTAAGGNDWALAQALVKRGPSHRVLSVADCDETRRIVDVMIAQDRHGAPALANLPAPNAMPLSRRSILMPRDPMHLASRRTGGWC